MWRCLISAFLIFKVVRSLPVDEWSAKYRNWTYYPSWIIPPKPKGQGLENATLTDVSVFFQLPGENTFKMFYTFQDHIGYQTALATSSDMINWDTNSGVIFTRSSDPSAFDYAGTTFIGPVFEDYNVTGNRNLKRIDGRFWVAYGGYKDRFKYEGPPCQDGLAFSYNGYNWFRTSTEAPIIGLNGSSTWDSECIYAPWLLNFNNTIYDFYNAGGKSSYGKHAEQSGVATLERTLLPGISGKISSWKRSNSPVLPSGPPGSVDSYQAADPKVFWDNDHWTMFYFANGDGTHGHASIAVAFSVDLHTWEKSPHPLYLAGGHPKGLDNIHAHKIALAYDPKRDTHFMYYTAVGNEGRGIALLTSKPIGNE